MDFVLYSCSPFLVLAYWAEIIYFFNIMFGLLVLIKQGGWNFFNFGDFEDKIFDHGGFIDHPQLKLICYLLPMFPHHSFVCQLVKNFGFIILFPLWFFTQEIVIQDVARQILFPIGNPSSQIQPKKMKKKWFNFIEDIKKWTLVEQTFGMTYCMYSCQLDFVMVWCCQD